MGLIICGCWYKFERVYAVAVEVADGLVNDRCLDDKSEGEVIPLWELVGAIE